ncbi:MAG: hypothetical protein LBM93_12360 [Oscillospiraceae bacterium]|jgi:hypothetical protein|nr:hypothetical protein [Oscillospiraceae bacterium]
MGRKKKFLKKTIKVLSIIIAFILIIIIIYTVIHPISMPNKLVEKYLFLKIDKGTSMENASKEIEDEWEIKEINHNYGVHFGKNGLPNRNNLETKENLVGSKYIYVRLGEYNIPTNTVVFAYFIFDKNGKLIQVATRRDVDSI